MKVLACGGRNYRDRDFVFRVMDEVHSTEPITCVVHGNAPGADSLADAWATENGIEVLAYPAQWTLHGRKAGPIRNSQMLEENPDIDCIVAFPGGAGTEDMIRKAKAKNIHDIVHRFRTEPPCR